MFEKAAQLGLVVIQNPTHLAIPPIAGKKMLDHEIVLKSFVNAGIPLALGSDGGLFNAPVKLADPANGPNACSGTPFGSNTDIRAGAKCLFLAPAERWLGHLRWLLVGLVCHVGATYLSEGYLYSRIQEAVSSPRLIDARDIGVSYFVVGIVGVLTYHIPRRWRWFYLVGALVVFGVSLAVKRDFTQLGHFSALLIGLGCYPLTRSRRRQAAPA